VEPETIEIARVASVRKASPGRLVVLCEGKKGRGFAICQSCGAGVDDRAMEHKTPLGSPCRGTVRRVALGHEFLTDVLRVRFHQRPASAATPDGMLWFGFSLAYALLYGAHEILEVPRQDLNVTVRGGEGDEVPEVVLYDDVPGGAGLVARLEEPEVFRECLVRARARVEGSCGCAGDTSCYGCLRSYANQFAHPRLRRGAVNSYLDEVLGRWRSGNP
jgi:hypothetical protein